MTPLNASASLRNCASVIVVFDPSVVIRRRLPQLRAAIKLKEQSPLGHFYLGRALAYQQRYDDATAELNLAMQLGGEAKISSREGGGTRVVVTFPLPRDEAGHA